MVRSDLSIHMRHAALFLFNRDKEINGAEMAKELTKAYGVDAPKRWTCIEWLKKFKSGEWKIGQLSDETRSGRPSEFDDERLRLLVEGFLSLHNALRCQEFKSMEEIREFVSDFFASKSKGFFVRGFTDLPGRWKEVIEYDGDYPPDLV